MLAGALEVQLMADVARLRKDMGDAKNTVTGAMGSINSAVSSATKLLASLGIGIGAVGLMRVAHDALATQDAFAKMSQKINVSVESLVGLEHAAKLSGSNLASLEKGLKSVSTQLFDANEGLAESKRNFAALGVEILDSNGNLKAADSVMIEAADRFKEMEDGTQKTALAVKIFGRAGLDLIPMLNQGSDGIAAMVAEGQKLNPITSESAHQAEIFNDNMERLTGTMSGFGMSLLNSVLPSLSEFSESTIEFVNSDEFDDWLETTGKAAEILAVIIASKLTVSIVASGKASLVAAIESARYQAALASMAGVSRTAAASQTLLASSAAGASKALALLGGPYGALLIAAGAVFTFREELGLVPYDAKEAADSIDSLKKSLEGLTVTQLELKQIRVLDQFDEAKEAISDFEEEIAKLESGLNQAIGRNGPGSNFHKNLLEELAQAKVNLEKSTEAASGYADALLTIEHRLSKTGEGLENFVGPTQEVAEEVVLMGEILGEAGGSTDNLTKSIEQQILSLQQQVVAAHLSGETQAVYNAVMRAGSDATDEQLNSIVELTRELYRKEQATRDATDADAAAARELEKLERANEAAAQAFIEDWNEVRTQAGSVFADFTEDADNAADAVVKTFKRMSDEILGQLIFTTGLKIAGIDIPGYSSSGNVLDSVFDDSGFAGNVAKSVFEKYGDQFGKNSGISDLVEGLGWGNSSGSLPGPNATGEDWASFYEGGTSGFDSAQFMSGLKTIGLNIAAGYVGGYAGSELGDALFGKTAESNIAESIGAAVGSIWGPIGTLVGSTFGAMVDAAFGGDGKVRQNAGFFVAPTPGAQDDPSRIFDVDPFESGMQVQGFARRADRSFAEDIIDTFRGVDAISSSIIRALGGVIDLSNATLAGLDEEATPGSAGTFLGLGGNGGLAGDILAQLDLYFDQLLDHATGLPAELIEAAKAAESAEEGIRILSEAYIAQEAEAEAAALAAEEAAAVLEELARLETELLNARIQSVSAMTSELQAVLELQRSVQMSLYEAMGVTNLFANDNSVTAQIARIAERRELALEAYEDEIRLEEELHNTRLSLARSFLDFTNSLRLGDYSNFSSAEKFAFAQNDFRALAEAAQSGDMDALDRLRGAADAYVQQADAMYASSAGRKDVVSEVLGIMDSLSEELAASEFDPNEAHADLIAKLSALDNELGSIAYGVNESIIAELQTINTNLEELSPEMAEGLIGAIGQWIDTTNPGGSEIINALGGIEGSIDSLPPEIASYLTSSMGQYIVSMLNDGSPTQLIADSISDNGLDEVAANQFLSDSGVVGTVDDFRSSINDAFSGDDIRAYVDGIAASGLSDSEVIRQVYNDAVANGIGSKQLAEALDIPQSDILDAVMAMGLPAFANGGMHSGGLRIVGERGWELEASGPARYLNQDQLASTLMGRNDNAPVVNELRALRDENRALRAEMSEVKRAILVKGEVDSEMMGKNNRALDSIDSKLDNGNVVGSRRSA
ncbi:MAG: hypothetical protein R3332_00465 [Pseudohongiellaceae bacterium]|nr:hypothetical protein [Pseudohongiellaceae bacterium]